MKDFLRRAGQASKGGDAPPSIPEERVKSWLRTFNGDDPPCPPCGPESLHGFLDCLDACIERAARIPAESMTPSQLHDLGTMLDVISVFRGLLHNV